MKTLYDLNPLLEEIDSQLADANKRRTQKIADARTAKEVLQGHESDTTAVDAVIAGKPLPVTVSREETYHAALREIVVIDKAIDNLHSKRMHEKAVASRKLCELVRPEYEKIVSNLAKTLLELNERAGDYYKFMDAVESKGSACSLPQFYTNAFSHPKDHSSPLGYTLRTMRDAGLIKANDVPVDLR